MFIKMPIGIDVPTTTRQTFFITVFLFLSMTQLTDHDVYQLHTYVPFDRGTVQLDRFHPPQNMPESM